MVVQDGPLDPVEAIYDARYFDLVKHMPDVSHTATEDWCDEHPDF